MPSAASVEILPVEATDDLRFTQLALLRARLWRAE
jgi:hypothetical protein